MASAVQRAVALVALLRLLPSPAGAQPIPFGESRTMHSSVLGEARVLHINLPQGYTPDSAARYPVIYLLDGGVDEDYFHIAGLVQFGSMPWVDWLGPSIVVGIVNADRKRDFTHPTSIAEDKAAFPTTGGSAAFIDFLGDELIPFIDSAYRTTGERMLIGQSLGGLLGAEVLFMRPGLFTRYLLVSPSFWWDGGSVLHRSPAFMREGLPRQVFIAVGKEGGVMVNGARKLAALVRKNKSINARLHRMPKEDHGSILHQAVVDGLRWMRANRSR